MSPVPPASVFIVRLVLSYTGGTVLAPILWSLPAVASKWESPSIVSANSGLSLAAALSFMFSFKYFLIALVLALLFRRSISNHLLPWCAASVAGVPVLWLAEAYFTGSRGQDLSAFLKAVAGSAAVVCCYVLVYAAIFYASNMVSRRRAQHEPGLAT